MRGKPRVEDYDRAMALRAETGWGARRIAAELGLPKGTVSHWLMGKRNPRLRAERYEAYRGLPLPPTRRCTGPCGEVKPRKEFYTLARPDGTSYLYPRCKECKQASAQARRDAGRERTNELDRKSHVRRRNRRARGEGNRMTVPAGPFLEFIERWRPLLPENDQKRVADARKSGNLQYYTADRILTSLGKPEVARLLYPDA